MSWAEPDDLIDSWIGENPPTDTKKVQIWLDKAEREIRRQVPDIQARINAEAAEDPSREDLLADAIDVAVEMVTRVFLNPERTRSVSENIGTGPMSEGRTITHGGDNPGKLYLAADELAKLKPQFKRGAAFEIDLMPARSQGANSWPL